ncbi:MAG: hypothetical protein ACQESR_26150 [Planctomycetota bacterium]
MESRATQAVLPLVGLAAAGVSSDFIPRLSYGPPLACRGSWTISRASFPADGGPRTLQVIVHGQETDIPGRSHVRCTA